MCTNIHIPPFDECQQSVQIFPSFHLVYSAKELSELSTSLGMYAKAARKIVHEILHLHRG